MNKKSYKDKVNLISIETNEILHFNSIPDACKFLGTSRRLVNKAFVFNEPLKGYKVEIIYGKKRRTLKRLEDNVIDLPGEVWKPVANEFYKNNYSISNMGRVKSFYAKNDILMKPFTYEDYLYVQFSYMGISKHFSVAELVMNAFNPMLIKDNRIRYIDGNNKNLSLDNLMFNEMSILEGEIWTKISIIWLDNPFKGLLDKFANYEISSLGRVRYIEHFQIKLLLIKKANNELSFNVVYKKKHYHISLRKLMLLSFKPINECETYNDYINYKIIFADENNYNLNNLAWQKIELDNTWKIIPKYKNYKINIFGDIIDIFIIKNNKLYKENVNSYYFNIYK